MLSHAEVFLETLRRFLPRYVKALRLYHNVRHDMYVHTISDIDSYLACEVREDSLLMQVLCYPSDDKCVVEFKRFLQGWRDVYVFDVYSDGRVVVWFSSGDYTRSSTPMDFVSMVLEKHKGLVAKCLADIEKKDRKTEEAMQKLSAIAAMFKMLFG
jgi:hypothetical protein